MRAEGGTCYEWRVGAAAVADVPDDADPTPVAALSGERRTLVERALHPDGTLVSPETALGSWVRHEFLGGYVSIDGTVYRGRKLARTDAALFSRSVWLVLSLSRVAPGDAPADVALSLAPVPDAVRRVVDGLVGDDHPEPNRAELDADAVARFARETDALLFHAAAYEVRMDEAASP